MEAINYLLTNIPDRLKELDGFEGQIAQRQRDLAPTEPQSQSDPGAPHQQPGHLGIRGSQESLRLCDEPEAHPRKATPQPRSGSVITAEAAAPVLYDSNVQLFFVDLVKFVSISRNGIRKATMAGRVAQVRRMAGLEAPEGAGGEAGPSTPSSSDGAIAPLEAAPTVMEDGEAEEGDVDGRGGMGPPGLNLLKKLDKRLEDVQSLCEHAAHRFLRSGGSAEEVGKIRDHLAEIKNLADRELERVQREEPDVFNAAEDSRSLPSGSR
ncbi:hypothetical protein B0T19DRAFT_436036 [Cercophora scortea]|uniref:Uncharacterized protein n=1 Tax=Cercophora scortea TaxID=314031 RepID=A0AAE0MKL5_9PEZI|nr:hypothetical protein B0T19DRAFT_436036 [Cercophora scortea]